MTQALIVVDFQTGVAADGPQDYESVRDTIAALLQRFRTAGAPVFFVEHNGEGKTVAEIAPLPTEPLIPKKYNSAFRQTNLGEMLDKSGIDTVVIVGMQTDYCIDATVKAAFERGLNVIVPEGTTTTCDSPILTATQIRAHYRAMWSGRYATCPLPEAVAVS